MGQAFRGTIQSGTIDEMRNRFGIVLSNDVHPTNECMIVCNLMKIHFCSCISWEPVLNNGP